MPNPLHVIASGCLALALTGPAAGQNAAPAGGSPASPPPVPRSPLLRPSNEPKPAPRATLFDPSVNVKEAVDAAVKRGGPERRRVLVIWGDNASRWSIRLEEHLVIPDTERLLRYHYEVVRADIGDPIAGPLNLALAQAYGAKIETGRHMMPYFTIIETIGEKAGQAILNRSSKGLENPRSSKTDGNYFAIRIQRFLAEQAAPPLNAEEHFAAAKAEAVKRSAPIFLVFEDPEDYWCTRLLSWVEKPETRALLDPHVVVCIVDRVRMVGGAKLADDLGAAEAEAEPWYVFLDAEGKRLAPDKTKGERDLGLPTGQEIEPFVKMLRRIAPSIKNEQAGAITESLRRAQVVAQPK